MENKPIQPQQPKHKISVVVAPRMTKISVRMDLNGNIIEKRVSKPSIDKVDIKGKKDK